MVDIINHGALELQIDRSLCVVVVTSVLVMEIYGSNLREEFYYIFRPTLFRTS
jgi:hypothetical protein